MGGEKQLKTNHKPIECSQVHKTLSWRNPSIQGQPCLNWK